MKKTLTLLAFLFSLNFEQANSFEWRVNKNESYIKIKFKNSTSPVEAEFTNFKSNIFFDQKDLLSCKIVIDVDVSSINFDNKDFIEIARNGNWLAAKTHPWSNLTTKKCYKKNDEFLAESNLAIRGLNLPALLKFKFIKYDDKSAIAVGSLLIDRKKYKIGDSDKDKDPLISKEVEVNFKITASKNFNK